MNENVREPYILGNRQCTWRGITPGVGIVHHAYMVETKPHFLREWRKHRDLKLEKVAEIAGEAHGFKTTYATLSRIERGALPYNQRLLEVLAAIYRTTVPALLGSDPNTAGARLFAEWAEEDLRELEQLEGDDRQQVVALARRLGR